MFKHGLMWMMACWSMEVWAQLSAPAAPVFKVGDVAVYAVNQRADRKIFEEKITVVAVDASGIRSRHERADGTPPTEGFMSPDLGLAVSGSSGNRFDPPIRWVKFPLNVGDSWEAAYEGTGTNQARSKSSMSFKVAAAEKVGTPAGEFDALRIESKGWINGITWQGTIQVNQVQWYAPAVGRIVKSEFKDFRGGRLWSDTLTELKSFTPAP